MTGILFKDESYRIIGACFAVHNEMGAGFLEPVYQECLQIELTDQHIPFVAQPELGLQYRGVALKQRYRPDFLCFGQIIVELKAVSSITKEHRAQVLNYLHATGFTLGRLVNFGQHSRLEHERIVHSSVG